MPLHNRWLCAHALPVPARKQRRVTVLPAIHTAGTNAAPSMRPARQPAATKRRPVACGALSVKYPLCGSTRQAAARKHGWHTHWPVAPTRAHMHVSQGTSAHT